MKYLTKWLKKNPGMTESYAINPLIKEKNMRSSSVILLMITLVILNCATDSVFLRRAATPYINPVARVSLSGYVTDNINSQPVPDARYDPTRQ